MNSDNNACVNLPNISLLINKKLFIIIKCPLQGFCRGVSNTEICKSVGKFPNDQLQDCRGFTACNENTKGGFYNYDLGCPANYVFNHFDHQCRNSSVYQCFPEYNCTSIGNFDYPSNKECTSYIACVTGLTTIVTARLIDCAPDTIFNPNVGKCVDPSEYNCPRDLSDTSFTNGDSTTEMFFIYNNTSGKEFTSRNSTSAASCASFQIVVLSLLTIYRILLI